MAEALGFRFSKQAATRSRSLQNDQNNRPGLESVRNEATQGGRGKARDVPRAGVRTLLQFPRFRPLRGKDYRQWHSSRGGFRARFADDPGRNVRLHQPGESANELPRSSWTRFASAGDFAPLYGTVRLKSALSVPPAGTSNSRVVRPLNLSGSCLSLTGLSSEVSTSSCKAIITLCLPIIAPLQLWPT